MLFIHCIFTLFLTEDVHSFTGPYPLCPQYDHMPYLHCTFTLLMTGGSALTHGPLPIVPTIRPHALSPLHIHTTNDGRFCTHSRDRSRSANKTAACRISFMHSTRLDGLCCTHSRASTDSAKNTAPCRISIGHSH